VLFPDRLLEVLHSNAAATSDSAISSNAGIELCLRWARLDCSVCEVRLSRRNSFVALELVLVMEPFGLPSRFSTDDNADGRDRFSDDWEPKPLLLRLR